MLEKDPNVYAKTYYFPYYIKRFKFFVHNHLSAVSFLFSLPHLLFQHCDEPVYLFVFLLQQVYQLVRVACLTHR